jgi:hypothetical protein
MSGGAAARRDIADTTSDDRLIEDAIAVLDDAGARAPRDFLVSLSVVLAVVAALLLAGGAIADGALQDVLLNLASEVVGIGITVILIDGLWKRRETATSATLVSLTRRLESQRGVALGDDERAAWQGFVDDYRLATARETIPDRARAVTSYGRRVADLERRAERILATPRTAAADPSSGED